MYIMVVNTKQEALMPTKPSRVRRWIAEGKATPFWKKGLFCIRINVPVGTEVQQVALGIDPGSKKEGFTVKSNAHTYLNIQADAVTWVKRAVKVRREMRRSRRYRKCPHRRCRHNRGRGGLVPSTRARWGFKLRLINWLSSLIPITDVVVEDIATTTKEGKKRWNTSFSPLEVGKQYFYDEIEKRFRLHTFKGYETAEMRKTLGLKKCSNKMSSHFEAHCVDSWVLAHSVVGGSLDNISLLVMVPLRLHRRQLHAMVPQKGGVRRNYGGTRSLGFKRGSLVKHPKWGLSYVGGTSKGRMSLHNINDGKRLCQNAKPEDIKFLTYNTWRAAPPRPKGVVSAAKN